MKNISLLKIKADTKVRVADVVGGASFKNRLMSMGIYPGREIMKRGQFALRGPVMVKVGRSVLAIGHTIAGKIMVDIDD